MSIYITSFDLANQPLEVETITISGDYYLYLTHEEIEAMEIITQDI